MLSSLFSNPAMVLMRIPAILLALTVHETAHGYAAYKLGDPTARNFGRLSLNPLKHLDPIGTLMMLIFGFGWAKPVPINTRYFKKPRRDMAITAVAGPLSNIALSFVGLFLFMVCQKLLFSSVIGGNTFSYALLLFLSVFYTLNLYLGLFNLIPVPPMDGSRLLFVFLPDRYYFGLMKYERYIMMAMMLLLFTGVINVPLSYAASAIETGMRWIISLLPFLK